EDVLDFGTNFRFAAVPGAILLSERDVAAAFFAREAFRLWGAFGNYVALASIRRIAPSPCFLALQPGPDHNRIVDIGRCGHHVVNQLGAAVHADVSLHAKEPLVALPGLMHLRIALLLLVFGGTWGH